ncbi:MAG: DnaJ domain-containing protein [Rhodospirillales bacterium]
MSYLILGVAVMAGLLLAMQWFVSAEPKSIARALKWILLGLIGIVILFFILTGRLTWALWTLPALLPWIMRARQAARMAKNFSRMTGGGASGQSSEVTSAFLSMELDHDSGDMDGTVRKGRHEGATLSTLSLDQLLELFDDYSAEDGESARLLAAFLDRMHPDWREERRGGAEQGGDAFEEQAGRMSRAEAYRILGVEESADEAEIKSAHHRLIAGLHPDRGGSAYLAAKINEARDVLLKS